MQIMQDLPVRKAFRPCTRGTEHAHLPNGGSELDQDFSRYAPVSVSGSGEGQPIRQFN